MEDGPGWEIPAVDRGLSTDLEVDGGIDATTAKTAVQAGARVLVAGSAVFSQDDSVADAIARIRSSDAAAD